MLQDNLFSYFQKAHNKSANIYIIKVKNYLFYRFDTFVFLKYNMNEF